MNKVSGGICTSREQTSQRTVSMFWPKQMRDRNTSPNARRGKGKEQIVLSTCVGCGLENWPRSCWGHTIKKKKKVSHFWPHEFSSMPASLDIFLSSNRDSPDVTAQLFCHDVNTALQPNQLYRYIVCHMDRIKRTLPQHKPENSSCTQHSQLLLPASIWPLVLPQRRQSGWTGGKQSPRADCSYQVNAWAGMRWETLLLC